MWDSGVVLAKFLEHAVDSGKLSLKGTRVVELGAGCGLAGYNFLTSDSLYKNDNPNYKTSCIFENKRTEVFKSNSGRKLAVSKQCHFPCQKHFLYGYVV